MDYSYNYNAHNEGNNMSLATGTRVQFTSTDIPISIQGEFGTITKFTTEHRTAFPAGVYTVKLDDGREFTSAEAADFTVVPSEDIKSWNNYKMIVQLELAIRDRKDADYVMDLQNEIFSRMTR